MVATPATDHGAAQPVGECEPDLTDHEIHQLLLEAESRLRAPGQEPSDNSPSGPVSNGNPQPASTDVSKVFLDHSVRPYISQKDGTTAVDSAKTTSQKDASTAFGLKPIAPNSSSSAKDKPTAGSDWFNLPKTELTSELKRDLQLLRMRSILDPKRHYKKEGKKELAPEFSQVGTVIEGPGEFFSGRITKKERKKNLVDETLALERDTGRFGGRYTDVQSAKQSGKKAFYKNLKAKRKPRGK